MVVRWCASHDARRPVVLLLHSTRKTGRRSSVDAKRSDSQDWQMVGERWIDGWTTSKEISLLRDLEKGNSLFWPKEAAEPTLQLYCIERRIGSRPRRHPITIMASSRWYNCRSKKKLPQESSSASNSCLTRWWKSDTSKVGGCNRRNSDSSCYIACSFVPQPQLPCIAVAVHQSNLTWSWHKKASSSLTYLPRMDSCHHGLYYWRTLGGKRSLLSKRRSSTLCNLVELPKSNSNI